tara:strand:- start:672 stop:863 length:192 start_codon:yes stop_codon:yes gene_type:complete
MKSRGKYGGKSKEILEGNLKRNLKGNQKGIQGVESRWKSKNGNIDRNLEGNLKRNLEGIQGEI